MWLREISAFRVPSRALSALVMQPLCFLSPVARLWRGVCARRPGQLYQLFGARYIGMSIIFTSSLTACRLSGTAVWILKETWCARAAHRHILGGRSAAHGGMLQGCMLLLMTLFIGFHPFRGYYRAGQLIMLFIGYAFSRRSHDGCFAMRDMQGLQW